MRPGDLVTLAALLFLTVTGWLRHISPERRLQVTGLGLLGMALMAATRALSLHSPAAAQAVGDWLPCLLMLIVYWQAGRFSRSSEDSSRPTPGEKLQSWLLGFDRRRLGTLLDRWARHTSTTWIGTYFELAYLLCYALIPCGVGVLYRAHRHGAIDPYWTVVLTASYLCYGLVPFAQTLPPRLLPCACGKASEPTPTPKVRGVNLLILRHASIHLNTFPSAHVASTVGASLVLLRYEPAAGLVFLLIALSIAAGAVLGRYHYALDVILGVLLPIGIRFLLT
jgi:membrane-associated phospholipid phosphatase